MRSPSSGSGSPGCSERGWSGASSAPAASRGRATKWAPAALAAADAPVVKLGGGRRLGNVDRLVHRVDRHVYVEGRLLALDGHRELHVHGAHEVGDVGHVEHRTD